MITINKTITDNIVDGAQLIDNNGDAIYAPLSLCIVIADAITFSDKDIIGTYELAGYISIYYDYNGDIILSDGDESIRVLKKDVMEFSKRLWDLV